jgi:hypothetical protein
MKCQYIKQNKDHCKANAISGDTLCFTHNPKTRKAKMHAVIQGGKAPKPRKDAELLPELPLRSKEDYLELLGQTINSLRTNPMTHQKAHTISNLASVAIRIIDVEKDGRQMTLTDLFKQGLNIK